jgi:hypothetical protein
MVTATSSQHLPAPTATRTGLLTVGLVLAAVALTACGSSSAPRRAAARPDRSPSAGWAQISISAGATLSYPARWTRIKADRGAASVAQIGRGGIFLGYLNLTPRQGAETLRDWPRFRPHHNIEEGDRQVRSLSVRRDVAFRGGRGTCVTDSYATRTHSHYREIACLVVGHRSSVVVIGASSAAQWRQTAPVLNRAIHSLTL